MTSNNAIYAAGEFEVRVVEVADARLPPVETSNGRTKPATSSAYGIVHVPTGVNQGTTTLLTAAIRAAFQLNKDLSEARADPGDEKNPHPGGFGMPPLGFN